MSLPSRNALSTRKKDKKVSVSVANWMLGGSLLSGVSSTRTSRVVSLASSNPDNGSILSNSAKEKKEDKRAGKKDDKVEPKKEKAKENKEKDAHKKCEKCGKNVPSSVCKDEAKKSENKKTDTAEEKKDGSGDGVGTRWTSEKDAKIKEMKADNKSWKDIALEVGASKKDVQNRYKELTKSDGESEKRPEEKSTWDNSGGGNTSGWTTITDDDPLMGPENANMPDFGALFDDLDEDKGEKKDVQKSAGDWGTGNTGGNTWSKNDTGGHGWENKSSADKSTDGGKKHKGGKNNNGKQQNNSGGDSWNNNNSGATNNGRSNSWAATNPSVYNSHRSDESCSRFGAPFIDASTPQTSQDFGSGRRSGGEGKLKPDGAWSEDDCEVLEWLMSRYKEDKWLHIQSGFYNWTKRMVSWEIIEQKFREDGVL